MSWKKIMDIVDAEFADKELTVFDAIVHVEKFSKETGKFKKMKASPSEMSSRLRQRGYKVVGETTVNSSYGSSEHIKVFRKVVSAC